jgi:hypothetical protein
MKRPCWFALTLTALLATSAAGYVAPPGDTPSIEATTDGAAAELLAELQRKTHSSADQAGSSGPRRLVLILPACPGNQPELGLLDVSCPQALAICSSTPAINDVSMWVFIAPAGGAPPSLNEWTFVGQRCMLPSAASAAQALPVLTARDFRRLPLPPGGVNVQPPNLRTLINVPTNLFVEADVTVLDTTLLGFPVQVRATPQSFRWTFGDGRGLVTDDPGAAYPDLRITHTYTQPGAARLALTTTYSGEYSIAGGPWLPINGTAEVSSSPVTLTVLSAENHLIGGTG